MTLLQLNSINIHLDTLLSAGVYLAASVVLFLIGKFVYQAFHPKTKVDHELVEQDNFAFAISHVGYFVGLLLAIGGALVGESNGWIQDLIDLGIYGGMAIVFLNLSLLINDKIILRKFKVSKEIIEDQNAGTGVIEAASGITTGLILFGAISGEGGGPHTAAIAWLAGQIILILISVVYNLILPYNVHEHIEKDNVAVGVGFAGAMIAGGVLISHGLYGDFHGWKALAYDLTLETGIGLLLMPIVRFLTDKVLLPTRKMTDEIVNQEKPNVGVALIEAFAYIGGAVLLTWCI